jgi:predicted helicase
MPIQKYIDDVQKQFKTGIAREHAYRPALKTLLEDLLPDVTAINDPAHIKCGAPDFILHRRKIDVGYLEAKDVGIDLSKTEKTDQLKRYLESLDNLVLTDYLEFRFYLHGEKVEVVRIAEIVNGTIKPIPENYDRLKTLLLDFSAFQGQTIKSAKKLASMMAQKAKLMKHVFLLVLQADEDSTLKDQLKAFQSILMHDMDEAQFADVYAQTIAYGLFTARLHDTTPENFSRSEALLLIPKSNPFLRQLFSYVAGSELDQRVVWIVDALCEVFLFSDLNKILEDFGSATGQDDPILHFYETFLAEYDSKLRKARGVWYTPEPVVNFIVRAIDDVLKTHFDLPNGIADKSKIKIKVDSDRINKRSGKREQDEIEIHKVQLLDVATGTGTFMAEAVKQIYKKYQGQQGIWSAYVENDLLPRLHGFELLMASYAMCHMKLDLLLTETGYKPSKPDNPPRVSVYLTNSLEEHHPDADTLFASWLSKEANEASRIKRDMPIMVAFGNPPYSGESSNKGDWIMNLMDDYKKEAGGKVKLQERNAKWLNDDYAKFIRMGEEYVERNGEGVLAYITNHSYLDNPTFRGMRWHLMNTFDDIYIIDLHGSSQRQEITPDGSKDENVFDIQQGVAIIVAVKKKHKSTKLAKLYHLDMWGKRQQKYNELENSNFSNIKWDILTPSDPSYLFIKRNNDLFKSYNNFFSVDDIFSLSGNGILTKRDKLNIHKDAENVLKTMNFFLNNDESIVRHKFSLPDDVRDWKYEWAKQDLIDTGIKATNVVPITYRPFDTRYFYYTGKSRGIVGWPVPNLTQHFFQKENICLITARSNKSGRPDHFLVSKNVSEAKAGESRTQSCFMPLYRYESLMDGVEQKVPNFDPKIYAAIKKAIPDVTPESLFDYIYGVLHAPAYRERYAEFLKSDFPRIPYPHNVKIFNALAEQGAKLRGLHLMESPALDIPITTYPIDGDHEVTKPRFEGGNVYINDTQYFGNVPEVAWTFYIGGYQPAQKWLKDRKGRTLSIDDIMHYQRIIIALRNTASIMQDIDKIDFLPEGKDDKK